MVLFSVLLQPPDVCASSGLLGLHMTLLVQVSLDLLTSQALVLVKQWPQATRYVGHSYEYHIADIVHSSCYNFFPFPCLFPHLCSMASLLLFCSFLQGDQPIPTCFPQTFFPSLVSSLVSLCSTGLSHSLVTSLMVTMFPPPSIQFHDFLLR